MTSKRRRWALGVSSALALGAVCWVGLTARTAYDELTACRADLMEARQALGTSDFEAAGSAVTSAAGHAHSGSTAVQGLLWDAAAAIPLVGSTPSTVRAIAASLDHALASLSPAVASLEALDPSTLMAPGGRIDLAAVASAATPLETALRGVDEAERMLPEDVWATRARFVPSSVTAAGEELSTQLSTLHSTLTSAVAVSRIAPPLLGVDGPKRYFVGILNPNEARGIGGFLGTFAIIRADHGRIIVEHVGSNSELANFPRLPINLGEQYSLRYGEDPALIGNMNISPHFPDAAKLWVASWKATSGETLDGAFAADVVALGRLVSATDQSVALPDGGSMTGKQLTEFAISGIYAKFPQPGDSPTRKAYQVALTAAALKAVSASPNRRQLAAAVGAAFAERRLLLWSANTAIQRQLLDARVAGSLRVPDGHNVAFVAINSSGSKLDAFLKRSVTYQVGRCEVTKGRVQSRVTIRLTNDIPSGYQVPNYMISLAERGPTGPVNSTLAQMHLPNGSEFIEVTVDGESVGYSTFEEQGRASMVVAVNLPPREERIISVLFDEPANDGPGQAPSQPLGTDPQTKIVDRSC